MYAMSINEININDSVFFLMSIFRLTKKRILEYFEYVKLMYENRNITDVYLREISVEYSFDRIAKIDLAIARVVLYEIINKDIPVEIAIAESIRLSKKFSSYGSGKYLHAMIDSIYKQIKKEPLHA